jgi:hypothetical protein
MKQHVVGVGQHPPPPHRAKARKLEVAVDQLVVAARKLRDAVDQDTPAYESARAAHSALAQALLHLDATATHLDHHLESLREAARGRH